MRPTAMIRDLLVLRLIQQAVKQEEQRARTRLKDAAIELKVELELADLFRVVNRVLCQQVQMGSDIGAPGFLCCYKMYFV